MLDGQKLRLESPNDGFKGEFSVVTRISIAAGVLLLAAVAGCSVPRSVAEGGPLGSHRVDPSAKVLILNVQDGQEQGQDPAHGSGRGVGYPVSCSPQCLHLRAAARTSSAHAGQRFVGLELAMGDGFEGSGQGGPETAHTSATTQPTSDHPRNRFRRKMPTTLGWLRCWAMPLGRK